MTLEERFWDKVVKTEDGCWRWRGALDGDGYAQLMVEGKTKRAARWAYEFLVGPIPEGLTLDHVRSRGCRFKDCVNPDHLEPVSMKENIHRSDGQAAHNIRKTHCIRGHEFTEANTLTQRHRDGSYKGRECRVCNNARQREAWHRTKQKGHPAG